MLLESVLQFDGKMRIKKKSQLLDHGQVVGQQFQNQFQSARQQQHLPNGKRSVKPLPGMVLKKKSKLENFYLLHHLGPKKAKVYLVLSPKVRKLTINCLLLDLIKFLSLWQIKKILYRQLSVPFLLSILRPWQFPSWHKRHYLAVKKILL